MLVYIPVNHSPILIFRLHLQQAINVLHYEVTIYFKQYALDGIKMTLPEYEIAYYQGVAISNQS